MLGNGDETFQPQKTYPVGSSPSSVAVADLGNGQQDLIVANSGDDTVSVLLGNGDGTFTPATPVNGVGLRDTPYMADLNGDDIPDSVILDGSGSILYRQGLSGASDQFDPPVTLNKNGPLARDLTVVDMGTAGYAVAAADKSFDPALSTAADPFVYAVSLYTAASIGTYQPSVTLTTGIPNLVPTSITAGDLTGNGLDDLVVANALNDSVTIYLQETPGKFAAPITLPVGVAPSDIAIVDVNGDGLNDIVVTDQASGDVCVLMNDDNHSFSKSCYFRAATGLYGLDSSSATPTISSLADSVSLAAGDFTADGRLDLVVVNRGTNSFSVLSNDGNGGFSNPQPASTLSFTAIENGEDVVSSQPGPIVAGDFVNGDNLPDLAILMEDLGQVWIYANDGKGTFSFKSYVSVGPAPTGLSLYVNPTTKELDLLVGDSSGDILQLQGKGDGTFTVLNGNSADLELNPYADGQSQVLLTDQQNNQVVMETRSANSQPFTVAQTLAAKSAADAFAPAGAQWFNLDQNSPYADAVWVGSGSNSLYISRFDPQTQTWSYPTTYSVGDDPVSVSMEFTGVNSAPDLLIADQGSNDVSTLFGSYDANGDWTGREGPRLAADQSTAVAAGPIAATTRTLNGQSTASLIVFNGQNGTISVSPGVGQGFFADQKARVLNLPGNPVLAQAPVFNGPNSDSGTVLTTTGQLIDFDLDTFTAHVVPFKSPPSQPITTIQEMPDGELVAAEKHGNLVVLQFDSSSGSYGSYETAEVLSPSLLSQIPIEPSALAVLSDSDVLVTDAGGDQIFEYLSISIPPDVSISIPPDVSVSIPPGFNTHTEANTLPDLNVTELASIRFPSLVVGEAEADTFSPGDASLVLVVSLIAGVLMEADAGMQARAMAVPGGGDLPGDSAGGDLADDPAGGEVLDDSAKDTNTEGNSIEIDVKEMLRHIPLNPKTESLELDPSDAYSLTAPADVPYILLYWQMVGETQECPSSETASPEVAKRPFISRKAETPAGDQIRSPELNRPDSVGLARPDQMLPDRAGDRIDALARPKASLVPQAVPAPHVSTGPSRGHALPAAVMVDSVINSITVSRPGTEPVQAVSLLARPDLTGAIPAPIQSHVREQAFLLTLAVGGVVWPAESRTDQEKERHVF